MSISASQLNVIVSVLGGKKEGREYRCLCPVHNGHSLLVTEKDGKLLVKCHGGCEQDDVIRALTEQGLWGDAEPRTSSRNGLTPASGEVPEDIYDYIDPESGTLVATKGRFRTAAGTKFFQWKMPGSTWKDGLKGVKEADLPLYGADRLAKTDGPIFFVEGEKAAKACWTVGVLAVCAAGGASQKSFGAALDVLDRRDVITWPDNDDAGRGLMRVAWRKLEGRAQSLVYVTPDVPHKGDAFDYFGSGGTVAALMELVEQSRKEQGVEDIPDGLLVSLPDAGGYVRFEFASIGPGARGVIEAELTTWTEIPGFSRERFTGRLNVLSLSNREQYRRALDEMFGKEGWTARLNRACQLVIQAYRDRDDSLVLAEAPDEQAGFLLAPLLVPDGPTIIFGQGGSAKTYLALRLCASLALGVPFLGREVEPRAVLYVDYESSPGVLGKRLKRVLAGMGMECSVPAIFYWPGRGTALPEMLPALRRKIRKENIGVIVVDSAVLAAGADPERAETAARFFSALARLRIPSHIIAHVTKADDDKYPFGSIFYHNSARLTWNTKIVHEEGDSVSIGLYNRKANDGRLAKPIGLRITFEGTDGPVRFAQQEITSVPELSKGVPLRQRILEKLKQGAMTVDGLAEELDEKPEPIRSRLHELKKQVQHVTGPDGSSTKYWGLKVRQQE